MSSHKLALCMAMKIKNPQKKNQPTNPTQGIWGPKEKLDLVLGFADVN